MLPYSWLYDVSSPGWSQYVSSLTSACIASPTVSDITERSLPRRDKTHRCVFVNEVVMETPIPSSSKDIHQPGMRCEIIQPWPCMVEPLMFVHISLCAGICCILGLFG